MVSRNHFKTSRLLLKVNYNSDNLKNLYNVLIMFNEYPAKRGLVLIQPCNKKGTVFMMSKRICEAKRSWKNMLWHLLVFLILYPMSLLNPNSYFLSVIVDTRLALRHFLFSSISCWGIMKCLRYQQPSFVVNKLSK